MSVDWFAHFEPYENRVNHLYLDSRGVVTIGVGCEVFDPLDLPLKNRAGFPALRAEVFADYNAVKALPAGKSIVYYESVCRLHLDDADIDALFLKRLAPLVATADIMLPVGAPKEARMVMVDMLFNLGIEGCKRKFPKFCNLMREGKYHEASLECRRDGVQSSRNIWTRTALETL